MNKTKRVQPANDLQTLLQEEATPTEPEPTASKPEPTASKPERKSQTAPSREGKKQVCAHINKKAFHQLHILRLERDTSIEQLVIEGLNALFTMHDKPPIA